MNNKITLSRINFGWLRPFPSAGAKIRVLILKQSCQKLSTDSKYLLDFLKPIDYICQHPVPAGDPAAGSAKNPGPAGDLNFHDHLYQSGKMHSPAPIAARSSLRKMITVGDVILVIVIIAMAIFSLISIAATKRAGRSVRIEVAGSLHQQYNLGQRQEVTVTGPRGKTIIRIDAGTVQVTYSDCPDQICVKTGKIRHAGEMIVCVPNQVVVKIEGAQRPSLDVITE